MKILITGITGFVGSHLAEYILNLNEEHKVFGLCRWRSPRNNLANIYSEIVLLEGDLCDLSALVRHLKAVEPDIIFHLAAQSYVLTSFNSPIQTLWANVIGTANLLEAVRITEIDPVIHICSCYDEKTELLTKKGFLKYFEIKDDDMAVSIDPETKIISYKPIKRIIIQDYEGMMKHIKTRSIDLKLTPNHRLIFSKGPGKRLKFQKVSTIDKPKSRYYFPQGKYLGKIEDKIKIGSKFYNAKDIFYLMGLYIGDGYSRTSIKEVNNRSGLNRSEFLKLARDTKGKFKRIENNKNIYTFCHSHRVFLAIPKGDKARESAMRCLKRLGVEFKSYEREIYFTSQEFVDFFDEIGHSADTKDIPDWVFDYDSSYLKFLYQGLIDSDGYYYKTGERFNTVSSKLSESFIKLCLFIGKFVTVSKSRHSNTSSINGRFINSKECYRFSISDKPRLIEGENIESGYYKGKVWCLEIDGTHNFVVRRDGKTVFCGNSSEVYGQVSEADVPIKETCPFKPASPYAVSKVGEDMVAFQYWISYGTKTIRTRMFTHSVSKWTPVVLRDSKSGLIDIKYISEIRRAFKKGGYLSGKMHEDGTQIWDMSRSGLEVWNDNKWSKIKHLSCHPLNNHKMLEIVCRGGVIDTTNNHSIINEKGVEVKAGNLAINDKVKLTPLPSVESTFVPKELAWFYGFFIAEGCVTGGRMRIDNTDINKLKKVQGVLLKYLGIDSGIRPEGNMYRLILRKPFDIAKRFYQDCYASDKNKRIPKLILNADIKTKIAFLRGYNAGDGEESNNVRSEFYRFKTKSPILAAGLCFLVESALKVKYRISVEHRAEDRYFEIRCLSQVDTKNGRWLLKDDNNIMKITKLHYSDEVWDFETENHWFHAGIGGNLVHNTGPRRGDVFAMSFFAKQIAAAELNLIEPVVRVGNLKSVRTFCDVRDAVRAYWILVNKCKPGEVYNIGGNRTLTIGEALEILLSFSKTKFEVKVNPELLRPSDVTLQIPCIDKFRNETGWEPEIPLEKTLQDILDYWREELSRSPWKHLTVAK